MVESFQKKSTSCLFRGRVFKQKTPANKVHKLSQRADDFRSAQAGRRTRLLITQKVQGDLISAKRNLQKKLSPDRSCEKALAASLRWTWQIGYSEVISFSGNCEPFSQTEFFVARIKMGRRHEPTGPKVR